MAERTFKQQEQLDGGNFVNETLFNGFIAAFADRYNAAKSAHIDGNHYDELCNFIYSLAQLLRNAPQVYVCSATTDDEAEYSVRAFSMVIDGVIGSYAGQENLGPLTLGQTNYIYADLSAFPTITIASNTTGWPTTLHLELAEIAQPASGSWKDQHLTSRVHRHTLSAAGGGAADPGIKKITHATTSPAKIKKVASGATAWKVVVLVTTPFNGTAPVMTVGDAADNDRLVVTGDVNLKAAGRYEIPCGYEFGADTDVNAYLTPDGSNAGAATIFLEAM